MGEVPKGPCKNRLRKDGRRAARPARREEGEYASVFDRWPATKRTEAQVPRAQDAQERPQPGGMDRRPDCAGYFCSGP